MYSTGNLKEIRTFLGILLVMILVLHFYYFCYGALDQMRLTHPIIDRFVKNIGNSGLWRYNLTSKILAILALAGSRIGSSVSSKNKYTVWYSIAGSLLFCGSSVLLQLSYSLSTVACLYVLTTCTGLAILFYPISQVMARIRLSSDDPFNKLNQTFPQEEQVIDSPYGLKFPARYRLQNTFRNSSINLPNIYRGTLICSNPGGGKTAYFFRPLIDQLLAKGFTAFIYDFKFADLTLHAYNLFLQYRDRYRIPPSFFAIIFEDPERSHRCNVVPPSEMEYISDATESVRVLLIALNKSWQKKEGDFFIESAITFAAANLWFLKKYENGKYCTLPHLVELINADLPSLLSILRSIPEIESLVNPFVEAYVEKANEQLQGQLASVKIALSTLSSPNIYYILSGNDFALDINNPEDPKIVCMGSNPQRQLIYGAVISLYLTRMVRIINKPGQEPCLLAMDEFATLRFPGIDTLLATGRSNRIAPVLGIQDISQLRQTYGKDKADVIFNVPANLIVGMSSGETARLVSERIGKINQPRETHSTGVRDTTISQSTHLDPAVPASAISTLSAGEFVGIVADDPEHKIAQKVFHGEMIMDFQKMQKAIAGHSPLPIVRTLSPHELQDNFNSIKSDIKKMVSSHLEKMAKSTNLAKLILKRK